MELLELSSNQLLILALQCLNPLDHPLTLLAVVHEETDPVILEFDNNNDGAEFGGDLSGGKDDQSVRSTITNEFLSELKEEVVLQSLLHKQIHDKKEQVSQLQHRNGRRLLVVLPPDIQLVLSFKEEARRTNWVDTMLNSDERVEGMLTYLSKSNPKVYAKVAKNRKVSMKAPILSTPQTIALAQIAGLNDKHMKKMKLFLRHVAKVNIQMESEEVRRIDYQVGLHWKSKAVFGSYIHEWALTKWKEKKTPEQVHYWNSNLSSEIKAEINLYL
jgi:hypothetical protein